MSGPRASPISRAATFGAIDITGNDSAKLVHRIAATLDIAGAAGFGVAGDLEGSVDLAHDGRVVFGSGQITKIGADGVLSLSGRDSVVADASNTSSNSALVGLKSVKGELVLDHGAMVTTSGSLANGGFIGLFIGSLLKIKGALANSGTLQVGPSGNTLTAPSTVRAARLANIVGSSYGAIDLFGSSTAEATLDVAAPAGFGAAGVLSGLVSLSGDALAEFGSGQITTIAANSELSLNGSHAFVADASNTGSNSALKGLNTVVGELSLANGARVKTSGALTNGGEILVGGGSRLNINGALRNSGGIALSGSSTAEAILDVAWRAGFGAAGVLHGDLNLSGDALVEFKSGQITTIAANGVLSLNGSHAFVADASDTTSSSALKGLRTVTGELELAGGARVKKSGALTNSGVITVDGSALLNIKGALTNSGTINVFDSSTLTFAGAFTNDGSVTFSDDVDKLCGPDPRNRGLRPPQQLDVGVRRRRFERPDGDLRQHPRQADPRSGLLVPRNDRRLLHQGRRGHREDVCP